MTSKMNRSGTRGGIGAVLVVALLASAGCSCGKMCAPRACAPRTELYFREPLRTSGSYVITVTPYPDGRVFECSGTLPSAPGGEMCSEGAGFLREDHDAGTGDIVGLSLPSQFEAATLVIEVDGTETYRGDTELLRVEEPEWACGQEECRLPVLRAP